MPSSSSLTTTRSLRVTRYPAKPAPVPYQRGSNVSLRAHPVPTSLPSPEPREGIPAVAPGPTENPRARAIVLVNDGRFREPDQFQRLAINKVAV
ncbi:unnamed protein product [Lota lota]